MFFLIKFIVLVLFLMAFFFIPVGSKPLYDHIKAIGQTPPAQELKQDFVQNLTQLQTWLRAHEVLSGETSQEHQNTNATHGKKNPPTMKEPTEDVTQNHPTPPATTATQPKTEKIKTKSKKEKPATVRPPAVRSSGKTGGDTL